MLGLGALGFAPSLLEPLSNLLRLGGSLGGTDAFGPVENLIGFVALVWGVAIYIKATAVAQQFSYGRAIAAIVIAVGLVILVTLALAAATGAAVAAFISVLVGTVR